MSLPSGWKEFQDGQVLSADEINGYLQQGILVFDDASSRDSTLVGFVREGMLAYTRDNNDISYYDGSSWNLVTGVVEFASEAARDTAIPVPTEGRFAYITGTLRLYKYTSGSWVEQPINISFSSEAARNSAFPSPTNGQYAFTTDLGKLWQRSGGSWALQDTWIWADFSNTATGTYSSGGATYKYVAFTSPGSHTLTMTRAGYADVLILGGGGGGGLNLSGYSGGGGGAAWYGGLYFGATSYTAVVGNDGAPIVNGQNGNPGTPSRITGLTADVPGGGGGTGGRSNGPSGGGFNQSGYGAGSGTSGITSDITGTSVEYGGGGGAAANGNPTTSGIGRVIVRVRTA